MGHFKVKYIWLILSFILAMAVIPMAGCTGTTSTGPVSTALAATMVPDVNLDVYIYVNQSSPTTVPGSLVGLTTDIQIESLSIWGVVNNESYSIGGALTFASASDAGNLYSRLPKTNDIWTKLVGQTIYAVQGSGGPADSLENAINNNQFVPYNDSSALSQVAALPYSDSTRPAAICIVRPSQTAIDLLKKYINASTLSNVQSIFTWAKPQIIVVGLYGSGTLNISNLDQSFQNNTISDANAGIIASANSTYPGFIVDPTATRLLDNNGYSKITEGNLTEYETSISIGDGQSIPVLLNVDGNRIFLTASGNQTYAQTLMNSINR